MFSFSGFEDIDYFGSFDVELFIGQKDKHLPCLHIFVHLLEIFCVISYQIQILQVQNHLLQSLFSLLTRLISLALDRQKHAPSW